MSSSRVLTGSTGVDVHVGRRDAVAWAEKNRRFAETGVFGELEDESVASADYGKKD